MEGSGSPSDHRPLLPSHLPSPVSNFPYKDFLRFVLQSAAERPMNGAYWKQATTKQAYCLHSRWQHEFFWGI